MDWGVQCLTSSGALSLRDLGQERIYRTLEEATWKQGDW